MGYLVRKLRREKNMTQEQLCEKSGVSRGTISAIENGELKNVMTSTLIKIARALDTTVDQIFFEEGVQLIKRKRTLKGGDGDHLAVRVTGAACNQPCVAHLWVLPVDGRFA